MEWREVRRHGPGLLIAGLLLLAGLLLSACVEVEEVRDSRVIGPLGPTDMGTAQRAARIVLIRDGDTLMGRIRGDSMEPVLLDGTIVVLRRMAFADLEVGMDVAYANSHGEQIVHKLVRRRGSGWVAKGLNNPREDPELVTQANLIGVVYAVFFNQGEFEQRVDHGLKAEDF